MSEVDFKDIQTNTRYQGWEFFYTIHGAIPGITPSVAYRRVGAAELYHRKILKCPFCAARLIDMDADTRVELFGHANRVQIKCQIYLQCDRCHKETGINIT